MESLKARYVTPSLFDSWYSFEKELIKKLSQKASGAQSEETVLIRSFKYFDLNNNGSIEAEEFAKAIEKIGIMIPTRQVSISQIAPKGRPLARSKPLAGVLT